MTEQLQQSNTASPEDTKAFSSLTPAEAAARIGRARANRGIADPPSANAKPLAASFLKLANSPRRCDAEIAAWEQQQRQRLTGLDADTLWRRACIPALHDGHGAKAVQGESAAWHEKLAKVSGFDRGFIVALIGPRGTGKTQMAVEVMRTACKALRSSLYTTADELFCDIRSTFNNEGPTEREVIARFTRPDVLTIDELHRRSDSDFENRTLTQIVDARYREMRSTILISNQDKPTFCTSVDQSIISRVHECGGIIECNWHSFREVSA